MFCMGHQSSITDILNLCHQASFSFAIMEIMVHGWADSDHHWSTVYLLVILRKLSPFPLHRSATLQNNFCKTCTQKRLQGVNCVGHLKSKPPCNWSKVPGSYGRQQWERHRSSCWCFLLSSDYQNQSIDSKRCITSQLIEWAQPAQPAYSIESYSLTVHQLKTKFFTANILIFVSGGSPLLPALQPGQESLLPKLKANPNKNLLR